MIARIWHGYTNLTKADAYQQLLLREIFPSIKARNIPGFISIELLRSQQATGVEFITIMKFKTLDDVRLFAGENYKQAYVPDAARQLLLRFDAESQHYEVIL